MAKAKTKGPGLVGRSLRAYEEIPGRILHGVADAADAVLGTNPKRKRVTRRRVKKPPTAKQLAAREKFTKMVRARAADRAKTKRAAKPATKTNRTAHAGARRSNRLRRPSTNRATRARVKVKVSVNGRSRKAPARSRRNVEGFVDQSGFHPIRGSKGYDDSVDYDTETPIRRERSQPRRRRNALPPTSRRWTPAERARVSRASKAVRRSATRQASPSPGKSQSKPRRRGFFSLFRRNSTRTGIFEQFAGRESRNVSKYLASDHVPMDTDKLGGLEEFIVKQQGQPLKRIRFNPSKHALAASRGKSGRFKLHVLGAVKFKHRANPGELHDLGDIHKLVYVARKNHIDNRQVHYTHVLKAPFPALCVDHEGRPVIVDPLGGRKIDERGIID